MAQTDIILPLDPSDKAPVVRKIGIDDLKEALARGVDDFKAMPTHVIFLCLLYPAIGFLVAAAGLGFDLVPLLFPFAAGFALLGPFFAIGLYELSRRRENGLDTSWRHAFDVVHSPSFPSLVALGLLLLLIFAIWIAVAQSIYTSAFGYAPVSSPLEFLQNVFFTSAGMRIIVVGNLVGLVFAVVAATISVISFPLLLDRNVGVLPAIVTSIRVVAANPVTMAVWGLVVGAVLFVASLPLFIGLAITLPILGHATWHLYRRAVAPDPGHRPAFVQPESEPTYAADFPANLFSWFFRKRKD